MMNLPMMGSRSQVNVAPNRSTVEINGFAMESPVTPSATVMEIIDPISNQPQPIYGVEAYVRNDRTSTGNDSYLGLVMPTATKSMQGLSITNTVSTECYATTVSVGSDPGPPLNTSFIDFNSGFASANAHDIEKF